MERNVAQYLLYYRKAYKSSTKRQTLYIKFEFKQNSFESQISKDLIISLLLLPCGHKANVW